MGELETIKRVVVSELGKAGLNVEKIILFGSRARGNAADGSDWDILVVVDKAMTFPEVKRVLGDIQLVLAKKKIPNDIIIRSSQEFDRSKATVGNISYYADKEGVVS